LTEASIEAIRSDGIEPKTLLDRSNLSESLDLLQRFLQKTPNHFLATVSLFRIRKLLYEIVREKNLAKNLTKNAASPRRRGKESAVLLEVDKGLRESALAVFRIDDLSEEAQMALLMFITPLVEGIGIFSSSPLFNCVFSFVFSH